MKPEQHGETMAAGVVTSPALGELGGAWTRLLLVQADGVRDSDTLVTWLQGPVRYADLRQPRGFRDFDHVRGLRDLTFDDCLWLAESQGFAGVLRRDGDCFEWVRDLDFQPPAPAPDVGRLFWRDDLLIEEGRDICYVEHWHRDPLRAVRPSGALALRSNTGLQGGLVRVGDDFIYSRAREASLPAMPDLAACVRAYPEAAQDLVNCEISCGVIAGAQWLITRSTLPFRVGDDLSPARDAGGEIVVADRDEAGAQMRRPWSVTAREGDAFSGW